jgi:hypothetical protein
VSAIFPPERVQLACTAKMKDRGTTCTPRYVISPLKIIPPAVISTALRNDGAFAAT